MKARMLIAVLMGLMATSATAGILPSKTPLELLQEAEVVALATPDPELSVDSYEPIRAFVVDEVIVGPACLIGAKIKVESRLYSYRVLAKRDEQFIPSQALLFLRSARPGTTCDFTPCHSGVLLRDGKQLMVPKQWIRPGGYRFIADEMADFANVVDNVRQWSKTLATFRKSLTGPTNWIEATEQPDGTVKFRVLHDFNLDVF